MTKTKRALVLSLLAIVMCVSMLIGSTYAWFTDSVTSTNNKIQSGTLKLDLELLDKATKTWASVKENKTPIFTYENWEPGYTDVKILKIENEGTLALKWMAQFVSAVNLSPLANVLDVYVLPSATELSYPADRVDLSGWTYAGTVASFVNTIKETTNGTLTAEGTANAVAYLGIAIKMQESAGNDYQALTLGSFDILITATQLNYEEDSFDANYDANLTPPDEDGDIVKEIGGAIYAYNGNDARLYLVPEDYAGSTFTVADGIDTIGNYAFAYNNNVKEVTLPSSVTSLGRGFDSSKVEKVVLNEGLEQIDSRAFRATSNLEEVVIPSTVKTIADNAFQKSGIKSIVIPANVETIGETAFGSSKIETVVIEGNTTIQGYAFRGCPNLRTVYLNGDDVQFIASTLNGRNSMWFCNGESNNPNTSNITFYVANDTVAARLRTALGSENPATTPIYVGAGKTLYQ